MIRNANGDLQVEITNKYTILGHPFSGAENSTIVNHPYEYVRLFLNDMQDFLVMKYVESDVQCVNIKPLENFSSLLGLEIVPFNEIPPIRDFRFNCLGQTFFDGLFWFNTNAEFLNDFIEAEGIYEISDDEAAITNDSKILFYLNREFVHAINVNNGILMSKNGTNQLKTYNTYEEFLADGMYNFDEIKVLNIRNQI